MKPNDFLMADYTHSTEAKRLVHLVAGCWANGGGLSELVAATALAQAQAGHAVTLLFLDGEAEHPLVEVCRQAGVEVRIFHRSAPVRLFFSWDLFRHLDAYMRDAWHLYLYSCWTFPVWWGAFRARCLRVPYSVAPQGCLDPVRRAFGRVRKRIAWALFDRYLLARAAWLHATAETEATWMRAALGNVCPPIRLIPNGVDDALFDGVPPQPRTQTVLYLGRLHPLKGLDLLLEAWRRLENKDGWELVIAGPDDGVALSDESQVRQLPPCYGVAKVRLLKSAALVVLPTRSENFGIIVAEALWCRTPVICTKGAPWACLGEWWVDISAEALATALQKLMTMTPVEREISFAERFAAAPVDYNWHTIAEQLLP
ncbi:MAG: glycosyltransferase [Kiritimatiellae bacterium]|nr:glycosyltransferase [Kiritimatiellia bacterium]